jgi:hypothetical protein
MQRITDPICKESPCNALVSGKINFSPEAVSDSKSKASEFFTGDSLACRYHGDVINAAVPA